MADFDRPTQFTLPLGRAQPVDTMPSTAAQTPSPFLVRIRLGHTALGFDPVVDSARSLQLASDPASQMDWCGRSRASGMGARGTGDDQALTRQEKEQRGSRCFESATPPPLGSELLTLPFEVPRQNCRLE
jgi:hypothetical protein